MELQIRTTKKEELVDITTKIQELLNRKKIKEGICIVYCPHTTAGMTINEGADPTVRTDVIRALNNIVPEDIKYDHLEGNSPAHIKSILTGSSVTIIVERGMLKLGTWQSIFFCEYDGPRNRKVLIKTL